MDLYDQNSKVIGTTVFDKADLQRVRPYKWGLSNKGYVTRRGKQALHQLILHAPVGQEVDHINGDPLDNRRSNLRLANRSQQSINRKSPATDTLGVHRRGKSWEATIKVRLSRTFKTKKEAVAQRLRWEAEYHGPYAYRKSRVSR
jgi:hypothetical protein